MAMSVSHIPLIDAPLKISIWMIWMIRWSPSDPPWLVWNWDSTIPETIHRFFFAPLKIWSDFEFHDMLIVSSHYPPGYVDPFLIQIPWNPHNILSWSISVSGFFVYNTYTWEISITRGILGYHMVIIHYEVGSTAVRNPTSTTLKRTKASLSLLRASKADNTCGPKKNAGFVPECSGRKMGGSLEKCGVNWNQLRLNMIYQNDHWIPLNPQKVGFHQQKLRDVISEISTANMALLAERVGLFARRRGLS